MGDRCGTKTSFVREDAACNTIFDSSTDGNTHCAAADCFRIEGADENAVERMWDIGDVDDQHDKCKDEVEQCHERYELFSNLCDTIDTTDDNDCYDDCQNNTSDLNRHAEGIVQGRRDGVTLGEVTDTEAGDRCEKGEQEGKDLTEGALPAFARTEAVAEVVHRTPVYMPISFFSRYFIARVISEYLVIIPPAAAIHIQKMAPGPPITIAVAIPTMLPVPMVDARAVAIAWKGVMLLPSFSLEPPLSAPPMVRLNTKPSFLNCWPLLQKVMM